MGVFVDDPIKKSLVWALIKYDCCSYKRGEFGHRDRHVHRRTPCEYESRDWHGASTSQGMPKMAENHWRLRERHGTALRRNMLCLLFEFRLLASKTIRQ